MMVLKQVWVLRGGGKAILVSLWMQKLWSPCKPFFQKHSLASELWEEEGFSLMCWPHRSGKALDPICSSFQGNFAKLADLEARLQLLRSEAELQVSQHIS